MSFGILGPNGAGTTTTGSSSSSSPARRAFGLASPRGIGALALTLALCIAALFAIGLSIAAVAHVSGLQLISAATFLPLVFFAGLWIPRQEMPSAVQHISDYTPLAPACKPPRTRSRAPSHPPGRCS